MKAGAGADLWEHPGPRRSASQRVSRGARQGGALHHQTGEVRNEHAGPSACAGWLGKWARQ